MKNLNYFLIIFITCMINVSCTSGGAGTETAVQDSDPVVVDFPIAYVKRPLPLVVEQNNTEQLVETVLREPIQFNPGAALFIRDRATPSALETNITESLFSTDALYDVKGISVSFDGSKLLFSVRAPEIEDADEDEQPTWNIWEYDHTLQSSRRIISSDITAEEGQDISPSYLPDGRIVFSSTRQRLSKAILLDEGKPQFSALDEDRNVATQLLHVMDADGNNIKQITFNQSHDLFPTILKNGKIVFSRWDNAGRNNQISLYQINPDGTELELLYGFHSHATGNVNSNNLDGIVEFISAKQTPDGKLIVKLKQNISTRLGGEFVFVDWLNFTEINQTTIVANGTSGEGQVSATPFDVRTDDEVSIGGRYSSIEPLFDGSGRFLVSWSPCRLDGVDEQNNPVILPCSNQTISGATEANPLYGIWSFDPISGTQRPIVVGVEGVVAHEAVAMAPRALATTLVDNELAAEQILLDGNVGVIHIESVYDFDGIDLSPFGVATMADPVQTSASQRPARFIRIVKAVSMPNDDLVELNGTAFGRSRSELMRDILGYAVVEPDGSAMFQVPANVPFAISILDVNGRRITPRHQNWMSLKAGEIKKCHGCHTGQSELPHGRYTAEADSINSGAPTTGLPFPNTNPAMFANMGETMAEVNNRINGYQPLSTNINYSDYWNDPNVSLANPSVNYNYSDLNSASPTTLDCQLNWNSLCRISINYVDQIQPLWDLAREVFDNNGNLLEDNRCTLCHNENDEMGVTQIPAGQLVLLGEPSTDEPEHLVSYRELLFNDNVVELINGALIDELVPVFDANGNPVYEVDENGDLIFDANGDPIAVTQTINIAPTMRVSAANNSNNFFNLFANGGTHASRLSNAELKLVSEWLDIGGQYYNNPFDVPQN